MERFILECRICGVAFVDVELHVRHEAACRRRSQPEPPIVAPTLEAVIASEANAPRLLVHVAHRATDG